MTALFGDRPINAIAFDADAFIPPDDEASLVVAYLDDASLAVLFEIATDSSCCIGLLPHPRLKHVRLAFGIDPRLEKAVEDVFSQATAVKMDVLRCNGHMVLSSVVIGDPFTGSPGTAPTEGLAANIRRLIRLIKDLSKAIPFRVDLTTAKEKRITTVATGIVVVEDGRSATLSRHIVQSTAPNDSMLNALIYAPQSALIMVVYFIKTMLLPTKWASDRLPSFVAHIRSTTLCITSPQPVKVSIDGRVQSKVDTIDLVVTPAALKLLPGRHYEKSTKPRDEKEMFRTTGLPDEETHDSLRDRELPWFHRAAPNQFKELFQVLRQNAKPTESFIVLMILSTLLAAVGLFSNSAPVIIGAMILAPLMAPMMAMSMGFLRRNEEGMFRDSIQTFTIGVAVALACTVLVTWVTPLRVINSEIAARLQPTLLDMGIAVLAGVAGAYAHARAEVAKSLAGVAIAVALVPPLAVCGIGLGWGAPDVFLGAGLLFLTNFAGMVFAGAAAFLFLGFSPYTMSKRGVALATMAALAVSLMLVPGFYTLVQEQRIMRSIEGLDSHGVHVRDINVQPGSPLRITARLVAEHPLGVDEIDRVKAHIESLIGKEIRLEATTAVFR